MYKLTTFSFLCIYTNYKNKKLPLIARKGGILWVVTGGIILTLGAYIGVANYLWAVLPRSLLSLLSKCLR